MVGKAPSQDKKVAAHLLELADSISGHVRQMYSERPEMQAALANLEVSAAMARCRPFFTPSHDYEDLVARAIKSGPSSGVGAIANRLWPVHGQLPWVYHYKPRSAEEDLRSRIAFAEMIGPDGPMTAPHCRVGFTVMAEHTTYPLHAHPAVELYLVIAGTARWQTPTADRMVLPSEPVLHRSNEPHAMRTFAEPLLALWAWTGNIDAPATYC